MTSFGESPYQDFDTLLSLNGSNSSKEEIHEFLQASQSNMTKLESNIQNNAENQIRSSAENSLSSKAGKVSNENDNVATFRGN